ncbi:hypothetical protein [Pseudomonas sp. NFR16]|uniref:hypothetical protein n=1 Tax=Pseudomonas sp. NFR16 TaxID=1566248 RepID=UPI0008B7C403|nr:hypothetical protein [Pseudomonas sp. NFR16]SEI76997.1 hypothetical protein SAMN03159495_1631 [Pseudomonas sp. NFR16]
MADTQPDVHEIPQGRAASRLDVRRRALVGMGCLLGIVVICVGVIAYMLNHLETRRASVQPPMTALERARLLPPDPVLETAPRLDGLRYRDNDEPGIDGFSPSHTTERQVSPMPFNQTLIRQSGDLSLTHSLHASTEARQ